MALAWAGGLACVALAEGTVEGVVKLPAGPATNPGSAARYKSGAPAAAPEPPRAVVFLEGKFAPVDPQRPPVTRLEQQGLQFLPGVLPVQRGTRVEFPNRDDEYHNVLSYSKAKEFDLGRYLKQEQPPAVVFDQPGVVELNCEIHEHMRAHIVVLDTPHFTTTDAQGRYRLERLPPGRFTLKAWVNDKTVWQRAVELKDGATLRLNLPEP